MSEEKEKLSLDELEGAAGGMGLFADRDDERNYTYRDEVTPEYFCPKCGSRDVRNYDPGPAWQMRVKCLSCGYFGCRGDKEATHM